MHEEAPMLASVLSQMITLHKACFKDGTAPSTSDIAKAHAHAFYASSLRIIDACIRQQHAALM